MSPGRLQALARDVRERCLPVYRELGDVAFAFAQGSLVRGLTDASDFDVVIVWRAGAVPAERLAAVRRLNQGDPVAASVVDYREMHLDGFRRADHDVHAVHLTEAELAGSVDDLRGGRLASGLRDNLLQASGLDECLWIEDATGAGRALRSRLRPFPEAARREIRRVLANHREPDLDAMRRAAAREEWLAFHGRMHALMRMALAGLMARQDRYFIGESWARAGLVRAGVPLRVVELYDRAWSAADPDARIEALAALAEVALGADAGD